MSKSPVSNSAGKSGVLARLRGLRQFRRDENGATAIEFAMIATPFLALIIATIETAIVFLASQVMETTVQDSSRLIMTGQAQMQKIDAEKFRRSVCDRLATMFSCDNDDGIKVDVRKYANFSEADLSQPLDADGRLKIDPAFETGGPGEIVVVRVLYVWPVYVSLLGFNLSNMEGNNRLIMSTSVFRNEPFPSQ